MYQPSLSLPNSRIIRNFTSVFLIFILSFSFLIKLLPVNQANAQATQQVTWTTKGDFENNAVTTGTPTTRTNVDTISSVGDVKLRPWLSEISTIDSAGSVGKYTSVAVDSNNKIHISYWDETYRDLKYATNASGAWATSTIDSGGTVGKYTSVAVDSNNKIHISYFGGSGDLKYATNASGAWATSTIDSGGTVGLYSSIAVDSNNKIHISYFGGGYDLKYATNASGGAWVTSTIDWWEVDVGRYSSIAVDSNNKIHISYWDETYRDLKYATNASGAWATSTIDSAGIVGLYTSIAVDLNNRIHISYEDRTNYALKYATNISGNWATSTIDSVGSVGKYTSIAVDSDNKIHISYYKNISYDLKYATNASGAWATHTIDSVGSVGEYSSIAVDSNNKIHIGYYDGTNYDLKYATNSPYSSLGTIGGVNQSDVGLRVDAEGIGAGVKAKWSSLTFNSSALTTGQAIKFGIRTSDDGSTWSALKGRDGNAINWTTGSGNYLGQAFGESAYSAISGVSTSRYLDIVVQLESSGTNTPTLNDFTVTYDEIPMDSLPPITTASLSGIQGANEWYKSNVSVSLLAADNESGVAKTEYSLDGGNTWQIYTNSITISNEGTNSILYRSADNAGNVETQKSLEINIDKTKPITTANLEGIFGQNNWYTSDVQISFSATDNISGVSKTEYSIDGINWQTYIEPIVLSVEGQIQIYYRSTDSAGNIEDTNSTIISIDKSDPITSVTLIGTLGQNNWYITPVDVKLIPTDSVSGILQTQYSLNNGTTWLSYTGIPITLSTDGTTTILYKSTDYAGNEEISNTIQVPIDKSGPIISVLAPEQRDYQISEDIIINYLVTDDTSGVSSSIASLDGQSVSNNQILDLFSLPIGQHIFAVTATDKAGNISSEVIAFNTVSTPTSVISIISELLNSGQITNAGVANSLISLVSAALTSIENGNNNTAINQLNAFINSVEAKSGNKINEDAAALLIYAAQSIIDGL